MSATQKTLIATSLLMTACGGAPSAEVCDLLASIETPKVESNASSLSENGTRLNGISNNRLTFNRLSFNKLTANKLSANRLTFNRLSFNKLTANRLTFNRISLNKLTANRLTFNRISLNKLTANRISLNGEEEVAANGTEEVQDLASTEEGQELLEYVVGCALPPDRAVAVDVGDDVLIFPGKLGVAPAWENRALNGQEERWVSACLLAHVNAYGVSVPISVRAELIDADEVEREAFPIHEGAFFGSVTEGELFACAADDPEYARAASSDRSLRVCTDPTDDCAIPALGACADICQDYEPGIGWSGCSAGGAVYDEVVNVHLREDALMAACGQSR